MLTTSVASDLDIISWFSTSVNHAVLVTSGVLKQVPYWRKKCKSKCNCLEIENKGYK